MLNIETDLDVARAHGQRTVVRSTVPTVRQSVKITPTEETTGEPVLAREQRTTYVGKPPETWDWEDLRNYVVSSIQTRFGEFPIDPKKLLGIFKSFRTRYAEMAGPIAVAAFDVYGGYWGGAPISVQRFCKGSDQYFSNKIAEALRAAAA